MKRFPAYQDLSKEQDQVINLPLDGSYLIVGAPGTGKTVVALYRGAMLHSRGDAMLLVTHMKMLREYTDSVIKKFEIEGSIATFHSWFSSYYRSLTGKTAPALAPYVYDWAGVLEGLRSSRLRPGSLLYLIIDEGQDIPKHFYGLARLMSRNFTVFADENQRLYGDQSSSLQDIRREAIFRDGDVHYLRRNYRNTEPIAKLASAFYCSLESGIAELPKKPGDPPEMRGYMTFEQQVEAVRRYERVNDDLQIGVLVPDRRTLKKVVDGLGNRTENPVRYYDSKERLNGQSSLQFGDPGIIVLCYPSAKGLEFDTVFMPELQRAVKGEGTKHTSAAFKMTMYVMISRARDRLFMSYSGSPPPLLQAFPRQSCDWKA